MILVLASHVHGGASPELPVHDRHQLVARAGLPATPCVEEARQLLRRNVLDRIRHAARVPEEGLQINDGLFDPLGRSGLDSGDTAPQPDGGLFPRRNSMLAERWLLIKNTFQAARALEGGAREVYLSDSCGDDQALRDEVEHLLSSYDEAGDFLSEPAALGEEEPAAPNDRIGPYVISKRLAEGGMGTVYLAVRDDDVFRKVVALKLVREGLYDEATEKRFRQERHILARLQHPNIAAVLDGGSTAKERPYLVMEYVEGRPVDVFCDERSLSVRERVSLFRKVCDAVQYAHQNLVVHRDIKPTNLLVTPDGTPKLLDFGIAKLLATSPEPSDGSLSSSPPRAARNETMWTQASTQLGVMTPAYASPEQVRGEVLTTSTDIYSLGVVFYQLLTGHLPIDPGSSENEWARVISETQPKKPSQVREHDHSFSADLRGDLDSIAMKALAKDTEDRYASAQQLSEDLERFVQGFPVAAHPDTLRYRVAKLVRRHVLAVSAAATIGALLVASSLVTFALYRRAEEARRQAVEAQLEAEESARTADEVSEFLVGIFEVSDPNQARGNTITTRELLDKGAATIEEQLSSEPVVQARLMESLGRVHRNLGLYDEARALLTQALQVRRRELGEEHLDVADGLHALGGLYLDMGEPEQALPPLERALEIRERTLGRDHVDVAIALSDISFALNIGGEHERARSIAADAVSIFERTDVTVPQYPLALNNLARAYQSTGDIAAAVPIMERAHAIFEQSRPEGHPDVARSLNNLGAAYYRLGDYASSLGTFERALVAMERVLGSDHPNIGVLANNIALVAKRDGDLEKAKALYERSIAIHENSVGTENSDLAGTITNLANVNRELGELDKAVEQHERAARMVETNGGPRSLLGTILVHLGSTMLERGDEQKARRLLERGLEIAEQESGSAHVAVASALTPLARLDRRQGRLETAERRLDRAYAIVDRELSNAHDSRIECLVEWALLRAASGDIVGSEEKLRAALSAYGAGFDKGPARRYFDEARYWALRGDTGRAIELAGKAEELGLPTHKLHRSFELAALREHPRFPSAIVEP